MCPDETKLRHIERIFKLWNSEVYTRIFCINLRGSRIWKPWDIRKQLLKHAVLKCFPWRIQIKINLFLLLHSSDISIKTWFSTNNSLWTTPDHSWDVYLSDIHPMSIIVSLITSECWWPIANTGSLLCKEAISCDRNLARLIQNVLLWYLNMDQ